MIRIKKPPTPSVLDGPDSKGGKERADAITFYADPANAGKTYDKFAAYKDPEVKDALNGAFRLKCAYCESRYAATQPVDVEHYRPKGGCLLGETLTPPGYYWLAATWSNLLPSCIDCNRSRKQTLPDGTVQRLGKANQFPIVSEAKRATEPDEEGQEGRLLLHPYLDRPERHLFYKEDGIVGWQHPGKKPSAKGENSVRVYALLRQGLVQARRDLQLELRTDMRIASGLAQAVKQNPGDQVLEGLLTEIVDKLTDRVKPDREYSALARQMIKPFLQQLKDS